MGSDKLPVSVENGNHISIHAPRMGSDEMKQGRRENSHISIHAPRMGSDCWSGISASAMYTFQSTLPAWGATRLRASSGFIRDFNPRSPHGERRRFSRCSSSTLRISIHAPRMGSDSKVKAYSNDRIKWSTLREPHFLYSKNACFSPIVSMCAATSRTKNQRIRVSFGSYPGLAPTCFTLDWYRFPRL